MMLIGRLLAIAGAIVLCAWFALGARQAHDTTHAQSIIATANSLTPAQAEHVSSMLRTAGTLNPDLEVDVLRGQLDLLENQRAQAVRILESVVRREPQNIQGWLWLAQAVKSLSEIKLAVANIGRLDPLAVPKR